MKVNERIKARRIALGLSADDLANALGVSRATIYRYESAAIEKLPTSIIPPLAKALQCPPSELLGWDNNGNVSPELARNNDNLFEYLRLFNGLNKKGQDEALKRIQELSQLPQYSDEKSAE